MTLNNYFTVPIDSTREDRPKAKLWLMKPNFSKIDRIIGMSKLNGTFKFTNVNQISFQLSPFIFDELTKEQVKNPMYDLVKNKYIIKYEYNGFEDYFIIEDIKKVSSDSDTIQIVADSLCDELNKKTAQEFKYVATPIKDIVADILKMYAPLWTVDYVDPKLETMKRELEAQQTTVMAAIDSVNQLFDSVVIFNNKSRKMSFWHKDNVGINRGLRIRENSYLKSFEDSLVSKDVVTRIYPFGKEGLTINSVNPAGSDYIEDFSYFIKPFRRDANRNILEHSDYMSDELCHALLDYNDFYNSKLNVSTTLNEDYKKLLDEWSKQDLKVKELANIVQRQEDRIELLKPKSEWIDLGEKASNFSVTMEKSSYYMMVIKNIGTQAVVKMQGSETTIAPNQYAFIKVDAADFENALKAGEKLVAQVQVTAATPRLRVLFTRSSEYDYNEATTLELDEKYNYLKYKELLEDQTKALKMLESRLQNIDDSRIALTNSMHPSKFLSEELYKERELFVFGAIWQEENHTDAKALLEDAKKQLGKQSNLTRSVSINVVNFIQSLENKDDWDKLKAGDIIVFSNKMFGEKLRAYITEISIDHEANTINLTVSDVFDYKDLNTKLSEKLATVSSSAAQIRFTADQLKANSDKLSKMDELLQGEWDANKQRVLAGNETVEIGNHGIRVISNSNPSEWVALVGGVIAMTKDNGENFRTGITPDGINAETLIGKFVIGKNLWFENETGSMKFDKDGFEINANSFKLTTDTGKSYFDVLRSDIKEDAQARETRLRKEYKEQIQKAIDESVDVEKVIQDTAKTITDAFKDGVVTDVEKKMIQNSLATLEKENGEYLAEIERAQSHPYITYSDIERLEEAETVYRGMYDTLVTDINLAIADGLATSEEADKINKNIISFKEQVKKVLIITQEIMARTLDNQIELKINENMDYVVKLTNDIQDEMNDFSIALNGINDTIQESIADNIINASETEAIKTAFMLLNSEFDDITNRYEIITNNPMLPVNDKTDLDNKYNDYLNKMTAFEASVNTMIADGTSTEAEKLDYKTKFDALAFSKNEYATSYETCAIRISEQYTADAKGQAQRYTDGLIFEVNADIQDIADRMTKFEQDTVGAIQDGVVTEVEIARIKTHLDMIDRENADLEENYQNVSMYASSNQEMFNYAGAFRSDYIQAYTNLKNYLINAITDGKATDIEITEIQNLLNLYKTSYVSYSGCLQTFVIGITDILEDKMEEENEKIITVMQSVASGFEIGVTQGGRYSIIEFDPNNIKINAKAITLGYDGSSDVVITNGVTSIKNLVADKIRGGQLALGGSFEEVDTTKPKELVGYDDETGASIYDYPTVKKEYLDATMVRYDNLGNPTFQISENGDVYIEKLSVGSISAKYTNSNDASSTLATVSIEDKTFYVHPYPSDYMFDELVVSNSEEIALDSSIEPIYELKYDGSSPSRPLPCSKIPDMIPNILNHTYSFIVSNEYSTYSSDQFSSELIEILGIDGGGKIIINLNKMSVAWSVSFNKCTVQCYLNNGNIMYDPDSSSVTYGVQNYMSTYVALEGLNIQMWRNAGETENRIAMYLSYPGYSYVEGCTTYNFRDGIYATQNSTVFAKNCGGSVNRYGQYSNYGSNIYIQGTGISSLQYGKSTMPTNGGVVTKVGTVTFALEPKSTAEDKPVYEAPKTTAPVPKTRTWSTEIANNKYGSYWETTTRWKGRPVSGKWTGFSAQYGVWILPSSMRDTLKDKTITKVTVSIGRVSGYGYNKSVPFSLKLHKHTSLPTGSTGTSFSTEYKELSLPYGTRKTFDVTSAFKTALKSGVYYGFGVKSAYDTAHYAVLDKKLTVTVTYY